MMQNIQVKLNPGLSWHKQHSARGRFFLNKKTGLKFRKKLVRSYILSIVLYGAGEGWRRSVGLTLR